MIKQRCSSSLVQETMADGSIAIFDQESKSVHSLNPAAAAVWTACADGATAAQLEAALEDAFGARVTPDVLTAAVAELRRAGLIEVVGPMSVGAADVDLARRSVLRTIGGIGGALVPLVLTMTATEQRAQAFINGSMPT
jgi:PqqD family protein of HPr-rel-A system